MDQQSTNILMLTGILILSLSFAAFGFSENHIIFQVSGLLSSLMVILALAVTIDFDIRLSPKKLEKEPKKMTPYRIRRTLPTFS